MLEMKITITAAELVEALNSLANALSGKGAPVNHTEAPEAPVNPASCLQAAQSVPEAPASPTPAHGVPLSATPAQSPAPQAAYGNAVPVAPTAPVQQAAAPAPVVPLAPSLVPTTAPTYSLETIATAGSALIDAGKLDQLMQLLAKFGVDSLTNLAPENYGAVANELRALGARI